MRGIKNPLCVGLPDRVARLRLKSGWLVTQLAKVAGVGLTTWTKVEDRQRIPRIDTLEKIAAALSVTPSWLAYGPYAYEPFKQRRPPDVLPPEDPIPRPGTGTYRGSFRGVGQRIRNRRTELGLSIRWVAKNAGLSVQMIAKTEADRSIPKVDSCEAIAVALGLPPGLLAFGPEDEAAPVRRRRRKTKPAGEREPEVNSASPQDDGQTLT